MTRFRFEFEAVCPSDWDEAKAREWIAKHLTGEEKQTLRVMAYRIGSAYLHVSAAPDLYAALEALVTPAVHMETCASLYDDQGVMVENGSHLCDCGVAAALAALAKARGESPDGKD